MSGPGVPEAEILRDFPELEPADLRAALAYAADRIAEEQIYPVSGTDDACSDGSSGDDPLDSLPSDLGDAIVVSVVTHDGQRIDLRDSSN